MAAIAAASAVLLAVCAPAQAATPGHAPPRYGAPASWQPCPEGELTQVPEAERRLYSCATVAVPLDHRSPGTGTIDIAMMRRAADGPGRRIGSLFMNPGGPGGSGFAMPIRTARALSAEVRSRFDLIGFDPRGVARSNAVRCFTTAEEAAAVRDKLSGIGAELPDTVRAHHRYAQACREQAGPLLGHLATESVARDLDLLRRSVGDAKLTYVGFSYGTLLGATYVNLFPKQVRAIVLDGNVDPVLRTRNGLEYLRQRAIGQEAVIDAFLARCTEVRERCAFSEGDPVAKFAAIRDRLHEGPVTVPGFGELTLSMFTAGVGGYLYNATDYSELATLLQSVHDAIQPAAQPRAAAEPAALARFAIAARSGGVHDVRTDLDTPYTEDDSSFGVNCLDEPFPRGDTRFLRAVRTWEQVAPTVGPTHAISQLACGHWPVREPRRYAGPWNTKTPNPVLLFGNHHDPATNYVFNQRMSAALGNSRLVTVAAFGHTILGDSACADDIAARYLTELIAPPAGVVCKPNTEPFS